MKDANILTHFSNFLSILVNISMDVQLASLLNALIYGVPVTSLITAGDIWGLILL
jgi:hypothetical protein